MIVGMKKNPVGSFVNATFGSLHQMVVVPSGLWGDLLFAGGTLSILMLPQREQFAFSRKGLVHLSIQTLF